MVGEVLQKKIVFQNFSNVADDHNIYFQLEQHLKKQEGYIVEFETVYEEKSDDTDKVKAEVWRNAAVRKKMSLKKLIRTSKAMFDVP